MGPDNNEGEILYPTGQNYSLELMFAKFATAKIANYLNQLKPISNRCLLPKKTLKNDEHVSMGCPNWGLNM